MTKLILIGAGPKHATLYCTMNRNVWFTAYVQDC